MDRWWLTQLKVLERYSVFVKLKALYLDHITFTKSWMEMEILTFHLRIQQDKFYQIRLKLFLFMTPMNTNSFPHLLVTACFFFLIYKFNCL